MVKYNVSLEEQISDYLKQTGKEALSAHYIESDQRGFITFEFSGDTMLIPDLYGDGRYWLKRALIIAKENGMKKLKGATTRNIEPYCKMFGLKVVGYIVEREV